MPNKCLGCSFPSGVAAASSIHQATTSFCMLISAGPSGVASHALPCQLAWLLSHLVPPCHSFNETCKKKKKEEKKREREKKNCQHEEGKQKANLGRADASLILPLPLVAEMKRHDRYT